MVHDEDVYPPKGSAWERQEQISEKYGNALRSIYWDAKSLEEAQKMAADALWILGRPVHAKRT